MTQCKFIKDVGMKLPNENSPKKYRYYLVSCPYCGKEFETQARLYKKGGAKSCRECSSGIRPKSIYHRKHGLRNHPLYGIWASMKSRCCNSKSVQYKDYGGRGISVYPEWGNDFFSFYKWATKNGYKKGLEIDRIDKDGNYCPENCRFVCREINVNNTSRVRVNNTTGYTGVSRYNKSGKYYSKITLNGERITLGIFDTPEEANMVYKEAKKQKIEEVKNASN